jgi:hypothetical protein
MPRSADAELSSIICISFSVQLRLPDTERELTDNRSVDMVTTVIKHVRDREAVPAVYYCLGEYCQWWMYRAAGSWKI